MRTALILSVNVAAPGWLTTYNIGMKVTLGPGQTEPAQPWPFLVYLGSFIAWPGNKAKQQLNERFILISWYEVHRYFKVGNCIFERLLKNKELLSLKSLLSV